MKRSDSASENTFGTIYRVTPPFLKGIVKRCKAYINVIYVEDCWSVFFEGGDEFGRDSTHVPNQLGSTLQWLQVEATMWVCVKILFCICVYIYMYISWTSHFLTLNQLVLFITALHTLELPHPMNSHSFGGGKGPTPLIFSSDQGRSSDFRQTPPK